MTNNSRVDDVFADFRNALLDVIKKHRITGEEYGAASGWLQLAGSQDHEIALLLDVFLSPTIDDVSSLATNARGRGLGHPYWSCSYDFLLSGQLG